MKRLLQTVWLLSISVIPLLGLAQTRATGKVTDENGTPLAGVTVTQTNSNNSTLTDETGTFNLSLTSGTSISFSFIGYESRQAEFKGSPLQIQLKKKEENLEDVIVVGYGTTRKSQLTAAVSTVKGSDLVRTQSPDLGNALQGMAAGVTVTAPTGAPGTDAVIRIRGIGSLNSNNPLFIIDGIPVTNGLNTISPTDIESIEILKDASAASIYGARAANGVVLVTTRSGKAGKTMISLDASLGVASATRLPEMVSTAEYIQLQNEAFANDGNSNRNNDNAATLPNTDWLDAIFQQGITQKYSLAFSGGNEKSRFYLAGNMVDQTGIIVESGFKRYGLRSNISSDIKPWLKIGQNLNLTYDVTKNIGASGDGGRPGSLPGIVRYALIRPNAIPVFDPATGLYSDLPPASLYQNPNLYGDGKNPLALATYRNAEEMRYRMVGNVFAEAKLFTGLKFRTDLGLDFFMREQQNYAGQIPGDRTVLGSLNKSVNKYRNRFSTFNFTNTLNYSQRFGDRHQVGAVVGTEYVNYKADFFSGARNGFDDRADANGSLQYLGYGTGQQFTDGILQEWGLMSYFGRATYSFDDKYLFTASLRSDASSRFSKKNRTGYFPSVSVGWNISRENFMENINWLDDLKLRASWGRLGNQEIGFYPFATIYSTFNNVLSVVSQGNPDVKWESTEQTNVGLDFALLNRKLKVSADYYIRQSRDILIQLPISFTNGDALPPYVNGATMKNSGLDLTLNYSESRKDWSWDLTANITTLQNRVQSLYRSSEQIISAGNANILLKEGEPVSSFYGFKTDGIFQNQAEIAAHTGKDGALLQPTARPGDIRFRDINGDGVLDGDDRTILGSALPKFMYSLNGTLRYKQFDLNLFFNGVQGNKIYNEVDNIISSFDSRGFNTTKRFYDERWNGEGSSNSMPRATYLDPNNNRRTSDRYVQSGSFVRLKNVVLGYNLLGSGRMINGISSARVFVSAQNLFTITPYKGMDPEMYTNENLSNFGDLAAGIDMGTYPPAKVFTVGVQVNF